MNLGMVGDVFASEFWTKVMKESAERKLVEQVECFVLSDNELDKVVNQTSHREWRYMWLASKRPIKCCLTLASSNRKHKKNQRYDKISTYDPELECEE